MYVGANRNTGMGLDLEGMDSEHLTVECLEQGFGLTRVPFEDGSCRKRRRRRRRTSRVLDSGTEPNSQGLSGAKRKRHGWDVSDAAGVVGRESGWDKPPGERQSLPDWVSDLITDIGVSLAPSSLKAETADGVAPTSLRAGPLQGLSNLGQQAIVRFLNFVGNAGEITLHAKLEEGGEIVLEMETLRNEVSVVVH